MSALIIYPNLCAHLDAIFTSSFTMNVYFSVNVACEIYFIKPTNESRLI